MSTETFPTTLLEAVRYFTDLDRCERYMMEIRWPDGEPCCPKCGSVNVGRIEKRRVCQCREKGCRKQFSVKVGTIFEDSPLGLDKWLVAVWSIVNAKNGISSCELARALGVTQKTAWFMLHRIRLAMQTPAFRKISGKVETDETWYGGNVKFMRKAKRDRIKQIWGPGGKNKTIVQGMMERGGEMRAKVVPNLTKRHVQPGIRENIERGSTIYSDIGSWYAGLDADYVLEQVNHMIEYVRGEIHVNSIENFWSLLKRSIRGTYVAVSPWQLDRYLDEFCRRFNMRKLNDSDRFKTVMRYVVGRRLTYSQLTDG